MTATTTIKTNIDQTQDHKAKPSRTPRFIVALLALASLGTTALIGINVLGRQHSGNANTPLQGGPLDAAATLDPAVLVTLPPFALIDQSGNAFGSDQLAGKVWIADFIFTRCAGPCPMMTSRMAGLQAQLAQHPRWKDIRLVSITVDPGRDTPSALREYARLAHADDEHWVFLTGTREKVWKLIRDGFKLPVGEDPDTTEMPIFHSQKFVLVDQVGRVRGFYDGLSDDGRGALSQDLNHILQEQVATTSNLNNTSR